MPSFRLTLITGRSTKQGTGISTGKEHSDYRDAISRIELSQADMEREGLKEGDSLRLSTDNGVIEVRCCRGEVPEGLAFIAFGSVCNQLIGEDTCASGMPDAKHIEIELTKPD